MTDPLLKISDLNAYYGKTHILQGINLLAQPAELIVVAGGSGAGKTTLLKSILGLTQLTRSGSIIFNKRETVKKKTHKITAMGVGYVPQGRLLLPSMTVDEHLHYVWHKFRKKSQWSPEKIYSLFPELKERINVSGTHLSGGEQRMMAMGQALVSNSTLFQLKSQGMAILLVEQNLEIARALADRAYFFVNGKVAREIDGDTWRNNPADLAISSSHLS
jgi:branched-chain amino acid transport system ATP-binding protein